MKLKLLLSSILAVSCSQMATAAITATTATPQQIKRGIEIARAVEKSDLNYADEVVRADLTIIGADGTNAFRQFTMNTLEVISGGDKRAVVFSQPKDLAGFVALNHSEITEADKQWIYLPKLRRHRRLSSRDKTGSFAGSEFSYEDIIRWEYEKYSYSYIGKGKCSENNICEIIEDIPLYEYSAYSKMHESIDMKILQPRKIVYFDRNGNAFKELEFFDYKKVDNYWRPGRIQMTNTVTGAVSTIQWSNYQFKTGLKDKDFRVEKIKKWSL